MESTMTSRTESMTARTERFHGHREPSRRALATRSLTAADRATGVDRDRALSAHFEQFPPSIGSACRR